jgi:hypothetical protein
VAAARKSTPDVDDDGVDVTAEDDLDVEEFAEEDLDAEEFAEGELEAEQLAEGELEAEQLVEEDLEETSLEEAFDDEADDLDDEGLATDEVDEDPTELTAAPVGAEEEDVVVDVVAPPPDASFDDEDDEGIVAAVTGEDEDHEVDGLRDGEFVCRSCYMAKRETQLADPERLLCRDCA